jgi:hypothetical protein
LSKPELNEFIHLGAEVFTVIPAKAGIQEAQESLDPGFRRGDDVG